ncbi:MAG: YhfC family glutamic-type intramembrane protease [Peptoniphilaceae bacterium]
MKRRILTFILGSICFIASQPLLRIPILNYIQSTSRFSLFYVLNPLLTGILIVFSAGIFEEIFRFIFKKAFLKPIKTDILEPILFGLGHGISEALIILIPALSIVSIGNLKMAIIERILTIILHVGLTVIVWNGFQLNKKIRYLLIAVLIHGLTNSFIPIFSFSKNRIILIEGILLLVDILLIVYIYESRKNYTLKGEKNGKSKF